MVLEKPNSNINQISFFFYMWFENDKRIKYQNIGQTKVEIKKIIIIIEE